jgi:hypothetical protein
MKISAATLDPSIAQHRHDHPHGTLHPAVSAFTRFFGKYTNVSAR